MAPTTNLQPPPQSLTTEMLEAAWDDILQGIKARDRTLFVLLTSSGGVGISVQENTVRLCAKNDWQVKRIMQPAPRRVIEVLINNHFGFLSGPSISVTVTPFDLDALDNATELFRLKPDQWTLPNEEEIKEDILHLRDLIKTKNRHYKALEKQSAKFGMHTPPHIILSMEDIEEDIRVSTSKIEELKHSMVNARLKCVLKGNTVDPYLQVRLRADREQLEHTQKELDAITGVREEILENTARAADLEIIAKKVVNATDVVTRNVHLDTITGMIAELSLQLLDIDERVKSLIGSESDLTSFNHVELLYKDAANKHNVAEQTLKDTVEFVERIERTIAALKNEITEIEQF